MQENATDTDTPWWREVSHAAVTIEHQVTMSGGIVYFLEVHDGAGQKHRLRPSGVYWSRQDLRVQHPTAPAVGLWEPVGAPGEPVVDWAELGKLLDDGQPPTDNGEGVDDGLTPA